VEEIILFTQEEEGLPKTVVGAMVYCMPQEERKKEDLFLSPASSRKERGALPKRGEKERKRGRST